jgi:hypothetical protein
MLEDHRGLQALTVEPPIEAAFLTMEVQDIFPAEEDPDVPVCLTDVVFFSGGKALNGAWLTQKLKFDRDRSKLMGTWFGGDDRFLSFFYDDTYRMSYQPYEKPEKSYTGSYDASGSRLAIDIPGKGRVNTRMTREKKDDVLNLTFDGALPEDWKQTFRDKR